jgi:hypothetical protein
LMTARWKPKRKTPSEAVPMFTTWRGGEGEGVVGWQRGSLVEGKGGKDKSPKNSD